MSDDVIITRADARVCQKALRHYAADLEKAGGRRDPFDALAMAREATEDAIRHVDEQLAAPSPVPSAQDLDERLSAMPSLSGEQGESHRFGGLAVESKVRGPQLKPGEEPLNDEPGGEVT
jgi:hypothetical protein